MQRINVCLFCLATAVVLLSSGTARAESGLNYVERGDLSGEIYQSAELAGFDVAERVSFIRAVS